eukprot:TRINITY_DN18194_c1_g1_i1.p1 TRINITY_DN18194_c1_g1~~TRINITY_DN18194_c1_g1_i1.p1  ORF type:complete len:831 (+),score=143.95 TRINITY_DN18194_c1_g1_i1:201-2693(+)
MVILQSHGRRDEGSLVEVVSSMARMRAGADPSSPSCCCASRRPHRRTPWLVPAEHPMELIFFRKVYAKLLSQTGNSEAAGVPLICLQRSMCRLRRVLQDDSEFDAKQYDLNSDGIVGWWEFCILWRKEQFVMRLSRWERIFLTLEDPVRSRLGRLTSLAVLLAILLSATSFIVSTMPTMKYQQCPDCEPIPLEIFETMDTVCVALFTIEYLLSLSCSAFTRTELVNEDDLIEKLSTDYMIPMPTKGQRVIRWILSWPNLIDLAAILPSYVDMVVQAFHPGLRNEGNSNLKLIRLVRVVRAARLGRRFEAVIIIARAMRRSMRALWVLLLNLCMAMLICGAILFFLEQGEYNPEIKAFERPAGHGWHEKTQRYVEVKARSPFLSIPESFWWALVTSTTVGYGDVAPTTAAGKITAGLAMVWSLCVLALPVGVIGNNFQTVWTEYDTEKRNEKEVKENARRMAKLTLGNIDPLSYSRMVYVEVYHNGGVGFSQTNDIFIGEAELELDLDPESALVVSNQFCLPLVENRAKANRKVSGEVNLLYKWTPAEHRTPGTILKGELVITVLSARHLAAVDWKGSGISDPYVTLTVYPESPNASGAIEPKVERTETVFDELKPMWNEVKKFNFFWHQDGVNAKLELERRNATFAPKLMPTSTTKSSGLERSGTSSARSRGLQRSQTREDFGLPHLNPNRPNAPADLPKTTATLLADIPRMQEEVRTLTNLLPKLTSEVQTLREGMSSIMFELGMMEMRRTMDAPQGPSDVEHRGPPSGMPKVLGAGANFATMPGMVPEDPSDEKFALVHTDGLDGFEDALTITPGWQDDAHPHLTNDS